MGNSRTAKISGGLAVGAACLAMVASAALAQTKPLPENAPRPQLDLSKLSDFVLARPDDVSRNTAVIDFEAVQGPISGSGITLTNQYESDFGVTFGAGASVQSCRRSEITVTAAFASLCPYPSAASGNRAALHEVRAGGSAMVMNFSRPVDAVSMRINPTGGNNGETFIVQLNGFDASGQRVGAATIRFGWNDNAFTWPTNAALKTGNGGFARVTVEMRRVAQGNQAVRFLFDDLTLVYAPDVEDTPVLAALNQTRRPPRIEGAEVVQSSKTGDVQSALRLYPAATRIRTPIDWDAVDVTLGQQKDRGLTAAPHNNASVVDRAELPVLLPLQADTGSLDIVGNGDSYHADFSSDGRAYSLYGTRVLTVINPAPGASAPAQNVQIIETDYSLVASFSLYGASYTLERYCHNDSADEDPACHDRDALGDVAKKLVVVVGAAGERRP